VDLEGLRALVRERLDRGAVPQEACRITWFGPGSGQCCILCERVIRPTEIECECEHPRGGVIRFHQLCFAAWDEARQAPV
jgi:hypothetical protein